MIAFRNFLPLIEFPCGRTIAFERSWLTRVLCVAAERTGHGKWWLADHVAASVEAWLGTHLNENVVPFNRLTRAVKNSLTTIGYPQIIGAFEQAAPFHRISLLEVARENGNGFELGFFHCLDRHIDDVLASGSTYCELHDLDHCVSFLCGRKAWAQQCATLRQEIVNFARETTTRRLGKQTDAPELFLYVV